MGVSLFIRHYLSFPPLENLLFCKPQRTDRRRQVWKSISYNSFIGIEKNIEVQSFKDRQKVRVQGSKGKRTTG